jgi:hypothetical protein
VCDDIHVAKALLLMSFLEKIVDLLRSRTDVAESVSEVQADHGASKTVAKVPLEGQEHATRAGESRQEDDRARVVGSSGPRFFHEDRAGDR